MRSPEAVLWSLRRFREFGYHVSILYLAVPSAVGLMTATLRYLRDVEQHSSGRMVNLADCDEAYEAVEESIEKL